MSVVTTAIITSVAKSPSDMMPRWSPILIIISSINPRAFISVPMPSASRLGMPVARAAIQQATPLPRIAAINTAPHIAQRKLVLSKAIFDFIQPKNRSAAEEAWKSFTEQGEQRGVIELCRADGKLIEAEFSAKAHFLPGRHLSVLRDITDRWNAEAERARLLEQETRARREAEESSRLKDEFQRDQDSDRLGVVADHALLREKQPDADQRRRRSSAAEQRGEAF